MPGLLVTLLSQGEPPDLRVWAYTGFIGLVLALLALDLGVFHREAHEVSMKEAAGWSVVWLSLGLAFSAVVYFAYERHWLGLGLSTAMYAGDGIVKGEVGGAAAAVQYLTGYVVEKSLAMDNIFVIAIVFGFFAIPSKYQHRVLFWGIIGALVMRGALILAGAELILRHQWTLIVFGRFLILTALKVALIRSENDPGKNLVVRLTRRLVPVVSFFDGQRFFTRRTVAPTYSLDPNTEREVQDPPPVGTLRAGWAATPLLLALIMVEITDLVFAVDSIPAIFAITPDPFIVFTSNVFAILGMKSLYFCLAALIPRFRYLKPALIVILAFVGVKLLLMSVPPYLHPWGLSAEPVASVKLDPVVALGVVVGILARGRAFAGQEEPGRCQGRVDSFTAGDTT